MSDTPNRVGMTVRIKVGTLAGREATVTAIEVGGRGPLFQVDVPDSPFGRRPWYRRDEIEPVVPDA